MDPTGSNPISTRTPIIQSGSVGGKEKETAGISAEVPLTGGPEMELPKEVSAVGVTQRQPSAPIPQNLSQWVKPAGENVPVAVSTSPITIPLDDADIAAGLKQNPSNSWRWFAEFCKRLKLKIFRK